MEHKKATSSETMVEHIARCTASGMNVRAYCKEHNLTPSNYYYWLAKNRKPEKAGKFISIPAPETNTPVYISFINGTRVCFENMPPADYIKKLIS